MNSEVVRYGEECSGSPFVFFACRFKAAYHIFVGSWQMHAFIISSVITIPLYLIILFAVARCLKKNNSPEIRGSFYYLLISQGLADILAMLFISFFISFRLWNTGVYIRKSRILNPLVVITTYYFVKIRCFGNCLFALQRVVLVIFSEGRLSEKIKRTSFKAVILVHWILPAFLTVPVTIAQFHVAEENVWSNIVDICENSFPFIISIWILLTFIVCITCDISLIGHVWSYSAKNARAAREIRLSLIVLGQAVSFTLIFIHYTAEALLYIEWLPKELMFLVDYFPVVNGLESYINPWLYITINGQLRREVISLANSSGNNRVVSESNTT